MNHLSEEQLILYYYGEAERESVAEEHLAECASCRADFEELKRVLAAVNTLAVPERSADYGGEVWSRLRPRLREKYRSRWPAAMRPQKLAWAGAIAALVVIAFLTGLYWPRTEVPTARRQEAAPSAPAEIRERVLLASLVDHIERSQMILLDLTNRPGDRQVDIASDAAWARELLAENRIYRQSAMESGRTGIANLLDDLERILLEIANSPARISGGELSEIRQRIDAQGIIFKLRVIGSNMRREQDKAARELAHTTS
jgi:hypothetical protein